MRKEVTLLTLAAALVAGCGAGGDGTEEGMSVSERVDQYTTFRLTADLGSLSENQRRMIPLLIEAADIMDGLFWEQAYGDPEDLLSQTESAELRRYLAINYGPWDRLHDDEPFMEGFGPKQPGANLYPSDMTREEFERTARADPIRGDLLKGLYTLVRRDDEGRLISVPYHQAYAGSMRQASDLLRRAAALAEDAGFRRYLELRAEALVTGNYQPSDMAWMDMKENVLELVIGPIETYEDQLFGYKAAFEAFVLIKDMEWSQRLSRYAELLPELQRRLPVSEAYRREEPGTGSDLNAYDAVYYAGDANAGSKTIAINLPNDPEVQLQKGARRLQLKNAMRAKFEMILELIADELIASDQRQHITFDAFFANTMFHEVAHGLGIKNTLDGRGTVREALQEHYSALEEGKADVLGLFIIDQLHQMGELADGELMDNYVTFMAGIFRSVRFGASSAHGLANLARFNYFRMEGAFERRGERYSVNFEAMREAVRSLSERILTLQGDGDYEGAKAFMDEMAVMDETLQADLDRLQELGIPVDIVFEQGVEVLGLNRQGG
ncbi:Zn-dependent hydrolase [Gemmatimonadota bacterium]